MTNEQLAKKFLQYVNDNYDQLKIKHTAYCRNKMDKFDEDIFCETYLKIYETIVKNGLKDSSDYGFESYIFKSFKQNMKREGQYSRVKKRDDLNSDKIEKVYENWYNENNSATREKLIHDLWVDFSALYLLHQVELNFDSESFMLFRDKFLQSLTYKQLYAKHPNVKHIRDKVVMVQSWLRINVKKEDIKSAFVKMYHELINF